MDFVQMLSVLCENRQGETIMFAKGSHDVTTDFPLPARSKTRIKPGNSSLKKQKRKKKEEECTRKKKEKERKGKGKKKKENERKGKKKERKRNKGKEREREGKKGKEREREGKKGKERERKEKKGKERAKKKGGRKTFHKCHIFGWTHVHSCPLLQGNRKCDFGSAKFDTLPECLLLQGMKT